MKGMDAVILLLGALAGLANMAAVFAATLRLSARGAAITQNTLASPLLMAMAAAMFGLICSVGAIMLVSPAAADLFASTAPPWRAPATWISLTAGAGLAAAGAALVAVDLGAAVFSRRPAADQEAAAPAADPDPAQSEAVG